MPVEIVWTKAGRKSKKEGWEQVKCTLCKGHFEKG